MDACIEGMLGLLGVHACASSAAGPMMGAAWAAGTLPPVQKAVLGLLPTLAPADAPALWPDFLGTLLDLLRPELLTAAGGASPDAGKGRGGGGTSGEVPGLGDR